MNKKGFFPEIPLMDVPAAQSAKPVHYGATDFVVTLEDTDKKDYQAYLNVLEESGFIKYVDNGEGLDGAVFSATYTKDNIVLTVTYAQNIRKTYISVAFDLPLSEHLFYKDEYVAGNKEGAKTKLHMMEMWQFGNGFIFQLKNGHFIISDGGLEPDYLYVLDYLESLVPEGEKPVVEAWIFSHAHADHGGIMTGAMTNRAQAGRIYVEGIYYSEPNDRVKSMDPGAYHIVSRILGASRIFRTTKGERPNVYRPQTGQRYYFNDITMEILFAQEQLPRENYDGDFNDSSTICLFHIEGQKLLFTGDAHRGGLGFVKDNFSRNYLDLDVFTLNHHGFNTWDDFTYYAKIKTVLFTVRGDTPMRRARENVKIKEMCQEWFNWGDGTKILTFPYAVGSYESLPNKEWIYNKGQTRAIQPNIYTIHPKYFKKVKAVILDCEGILLDEENALKPGVLEVLNWLKKHDILMAAISDDAWRVTAERLNDAGILEYFDTVVGGNMVKEERPKPNILLKAAELIHAVREQIIVVGKTLPAIMATNEAGMRPVLIADQESITDELKLRSWVITDQIDEIISIVQTENEM